MANFTINMTLTDVALKDDDDNNNNILICIARFIQKEMSHKVLYNQR